MRQNKTIRRISLLFLIAMMLFPSRLFAAPLEEQQPLTKQNNIDVAEKEVDVNTVHDRRIIIEVVNNLDNLAFNPKKYGVTLVESYKILKNNEFIVVRVPESKDFYKKLREINQDPDVSIAEPVYIRTSSYVPADPYYSKQWYANRMDMSEAWEMTKGSSDVTIAVLDTGINKNHPDLKGRVLPGFDFVNNDSLPDDDHFHGTFIAGIIAANADRQGMTGLDFQSKILPVKVGNQKGTLSIEHIVEGIHYAMQQGADVINMSYSSTQPSLIEKKAIKAAYDAGIVLVAAAGNDNVITPQYPASYPGVISVSAIDQNDRKADFSNYGNYVDITAPGVNIFSTYYEGGYATAAGTSFSAPMVSALAGLIKAEHPSWKNYEIEWALEAGAESGEEWENVNGYGIVNGYKSLAVNLPDWTQDAPDTQADAKSINSSEKQKVDHPMDQDWYSFKVDSSSTVEINIHNHSTTLNLVGTVYDDNGKRYKMDQGHIGEGEQYQFQAEKGTYFLKVHDFYDHWSSQPYEIEITGTANAAKNQDVKSVFPDVDRYVEPIKLLHDRGIIRGFSNGTFKPEAKVTRLQAIQMILKEKGIDFENAVVQNPGYKDVDPDTYGYKAIAKASELGIVHGNLKGEFNPKDNLTRAQMAAIVVNAYDLTGSMEQDFSDVSKDYFAYDVINTLAANGITKGYEDNTFRPSLKVSREHFSVFLYNYIQQQK
ncbi:hypothetical protein GCM10008986_10310 [Salinibacillus aidingensis]|uniref:SLH domain-containing protein n=1 Tax=Salinibacillus aidingensis TaxID=237684 RepID=A0ABN1AZP8_9BACI